MKSLALPLAAALLTLGACFVADDASGGWLEPDLPQAEDAGLNFEAAWVHRYDNVTRNLPHGDVHRLSDGSYAVLQMPGGTTMELLRVSPEGVLFATHAFEVPQIYAGCPFMPNEETFVDDAVILSYGSFVMRVDLDEGGVIWQTELAGQLQHSSAAFWTLRHEHGGELSASRLDAATGESTVLELGADPIPDGEDLLGFRLVRHGDEATRRNFDGQEAIAHNSEVAILATFELDGGGVNGVAHVRAIELATGQERWAYRHDMGVYRAHGVTFATVGGRLLVNLARDLVALDLEAGTPDWTHRLPEAPKADWHEQGIDEGIGVHASANGAEVRAFAKTGEYVRLDAATGNPLTATARQQAFSEVEPLGDDYLLAVTPESKVQLLDAKLGFVYRSFRGIRSEYHAPVGAWYDAEADRLVLAGAGGIYAIDAPATNVVE